MRNIPRTIVWAGVALMLVTGIVHLIDAPDAFDEATYKGLLFAANGIGALIAAVGIARGARSWGWGLGLLVAAGAFVGYVASRTIGLPGIPAEPDAWLEPLGVVSLVAEGLLVGLAIWANQALGRLGESTAAQRTF